MKYWDRAWSLVEGCTPVSEACKNCWLASMHHRFREGVLTTRDGEFTGDIELMHDRLDIPLRSCHGNKMHELRLLER